MKRYGHLYEQVYDLVNLQVAYSNAKRGKKNYKQIQAFEGVAEEKLLELHHTLKNKEFRNGAYRIFRLMERGKQRTIYALPFYPDRILHHAVVQVLAPIWIKGFIRDTYASIPGRGIHDAVDRVKAAVRQCDGWYALKADIRQFYPSVDHDVLKAVLRSKIKDPDMLALLDEVIDSAPGIPIGNYLSQYFGNVVLSPMDHFIKEKLQIPHYFRYCDDFVLLHPDKKHLHWCRQAIAAFLRAYRLELKGNWQVFPISVRGVDFAGYISWPTHTLVRRKNIQRFKQRLKVKRMRLSEAQRLIHVTGSFKGWLRYADTKHLRQCRVLSVRSRANQYLIGLNRKLLAEPLRPF